MKKLTLSTAVILSTIALVVCINSNAKPKLNAANVTQKATERYVFKKFNGFNFSENLGQADGDTRIN